MVEVRGATWDEFDFEAAGWTVPEGPYDALPAAPGAAVHDRFGGAGAVAMTVILAGAKGNLRPDGTRPWIAVPDGAWASRHEAHAKRCYRCRMRRKTKIIATIGPATGSYPAIERMYEAGMSIVRLNMSHATHDEAASVINWVKTLNRKVRYAVPIMLDTQGPEIRTGALEEPLRLAAGETVFLDVEPPPPTTAKSPPSIAVDYGDLPDAVGVGDRVRLDNGLLSVDVVARVGDRLQCRVVDGGALGSRKHVNLPGVALNLPALTPKDRTDIAFGMEHEIDYVALSFARAPEDISELRDLLGPRARGPSRSWPRSRISKASRMLRTSPGRRTA